MVLDELGWAKGKSKSFNQSSAAMKKVFERKRWAILVKKILQLRDVVGVLNTRAIRKSMLARGGQEEHSGGIEKFTGRSNQEGRAERSYAARTEAQANAADLLPFGTHQPCSKSER